MSTEKPRRRRFWRIVPPGTLEQMPIHLSPQARNHRGDPAASLRRRAMLSSLFLLVVTLFACATIRSARAASAPVLSIIPDTRPLIPTVIITGIENGELLGTIRGEMRLFLGDKQIVPDGSGSFRVPAGILKTDVHTIAAPEGMQFVASKKGKRFYPVQAKQAQALAPKNRIYFRTQEEAQAAGYR